jgi:hypothetical protein
MCVHFLYTRAAQRTHKLQDVTGWLEDLPTQKVRAVHQGQGWYVFESGGFGVVCSVTIKPFKPQGMKAPAVLKMPRSDADILVGWVQFIRPVQLYCDAVCRIHSNTSHN